MEIMSDKLAVILIKVNRCGMGILNPSIIYFFSLPAEKKYFL